MGFGGTAPLLFYCGLQKYGLLLSYSVTLQFALAELRRPDGTVRPLYSSG